MIRESLVPDWQCTVDTAFGTDNEVHIWHLPCLSDSQSHHALSRLEDNERKRYASLISTVPRRVFVSHRFARRHLLAGYLSISPDELRLTRSSTGKPQLDDSCPALHFNVSHSGDRILFAVSRQLPVGVDVEKHRIIKNWQAIARRVFSDAEMNELLNSEAPAEAFIANWTRFEARQKCLGLGVFGNSGNEIDENLQVHSFVVDHEYKGAVACYGGISQPVIRFFRLDTDWLMERLD